MNKLYSLNLVQKHGTNQIVTPMLILSPDVKDAVNEIMGTVTLTMEKYGIYTERKVRDNVFKLFNSCSEISNMTRRSIYIDEEVSFTITEIYEVTHPEEVKSLLTSFKDSISNSI